MLSDIVTVQLNTQLNIFYKFYFLLNFNFYYYILFYSNSNMLRKHAIYIVLECPFNCK